MLQARELCKHKTKLCCRCACHKGIWGSGCRQGVSFTTQVIKPCIHWRADWVGLRCSVDA